MKEYSCGRVWDIKDEASEAINDVFEEDRRTQRLIEYLREIGERNRIMDKWERDDLAMAKDLEIRRMEERTRLLLGGKL